MDIRWDTTDNITKIQKEVKIISPVNNIKIGNVTHPPKQIEEIDDNKINNILDQNIEAKSEYSLLCDCKLITESLTKYLNDMKKEEYVNIDIKLILKRINWVKSFCILFTEKKKLNEITHATEHYQKKNYCILRNSYNFCDNSYDCKYYYSNSNKFKKDGNCNKQHFIYNYIVCDIYEIEKYINSIEDKKLLNFEEITKSIKTLNYVTEHMKCELDCRNKNMNSTINKVKKSNILNLMDNDDK